MSKVPSLLYSLKSGFRMILFLWNASLALSLFSQKRVHGVRDFKCKILFFLSILNLA